MSLDEKIGQLFMLPICPSRGEEHFEEWVDLIEKYHIGNGIVKQSDPITQVEFLSRLQAKSPLPLLISADAEWGLGMRMSGVLSFPRNMTLGAIQDRSLLFELGQEIGRQARLVGIHMNLAPVADVNNNPANPIIGIRSFGEDPHRVADCVSAFSQGLASAGLLSCAKHFPGHGDTAVDSHRELPLIPHSIERLRQVEWIPFQKLIKENIPALMTAHLLVPSIDPSLPASLSPLCTQFLRNELHFQGLIITDGLNMKALTNHMSSVEIALLARKGGADLLLYGDHIAPRVDQILRETIPHAFEALREAYLSEELDLNELDQTVERILDAKARIQPIPTPEDWILSLHTPKALELKKRLYQEAITLIGEERFPIPSNVRYLSFGTDDLLGNELKGEGEITVVAIHQKEALTQEAIRQIEALGKEAIVCLFTTPYLLHQFALPRTVLVAYENDPDAQRALLAVLKGERAAKGRLPISISAPSTVLE